MVDINKIQELDYMVESRLLSSNDTDIGIDIPNNAFSNDFPNGWRRVAVMLPFEKIPADCNELKFTVLIKNKKGEEIESESTLIKLE
jgi:hypothetical protein